MTKADVESFKAYLRACTTTQVHGVYMKEKAARRRTETKLAENELRSRGVQP